MIRFTIMGKPKGKARPRFWKGMAITPKETAQAEKLIGEECWLAMVAQQARRLSGAVELSIEAIFEIPKSWSPTDQAAARTGEMPHVSKPDKDNIEKLVMDALNGIAWADDSQVSRGPITKRYGLCARTVVTVRSIDAPKSPAQRRREALAVTGAPMPPKRKKARTRPRQAPEVLAFPRRIR